MSPALIPGRRSEPFALLKVALRLLHAADIADALDDLAEMESRSSLRRFLASGQAQIAEQAHEFREVSDVDAEAAAAAVKEILLDQATQSKRSRDVQLRFLAAAVDGGPALQKFLRQESQFGEAPSPYSWGVDQQTYFDRLLAATCEVISQWVTTNRHDAPTVQLACLREANRRVREVQKDTGEIRNLVKNLSLQFDPPPVVDEIRTYRDVVASAAPPRLVDRDSEIARIQRFATGQGSPWLGWHGAPLSGKTGLMATIATQGIPGVDIVPFLIVRNQVSENDRQAFLSRTLPFLAYFSGDKQISRPSDPSKHATYSPQC